jgi:hypothetical protein
MSGSGSSEEALVVKCRMLMLDIEAGSTLKKMTGKACLDL